MQRTTISLSDELASALDSAARRRNASRSEIAREAIAEHLGLGERPRELPFAAVGSGGERDGARRMKQILANEWGDPARRR
jgi:predicted transcriptional regulator